MIRQRRRRQPQFPVPSSRFPPSPGRVGAARRHVDRVAAPRARLAGQARADPVGVRRDRARAAPARARRDPLPRRAGARRRASACSTRTASTPAGYRLHVVPNDRVWLRDSAPTAVHDDDGRVALVNWQFNAWAKYDNYARDARVGEAIAAHHRPAAHRAGAARHRRTRRARGRRHRDERRGDAARHRRVAALRRAGAEPRPDRATATSSVFRDYLGIRQTIWLGEGLRRRRHARARRRHRALRRAGRDRARVRGRSGGREPPSLGATTCGGSSSSSGSALQRRQASLSRARSS